ncbi:MAG: hypothetical protein WED04_06770 [Promethearchaeati archaeon SRVP18_Atabeyarchaeia-1]
MLDREVIKELLNEELDGIRIPEEISIDDITEAFCQYVEDDYYEWLKDNFRVFFNHGNPDWDVIRKKVGLVPRMGQIKDVTHSTTVQLPDS